MHVASLVRTPAIIERPYDWTLIDLIIPVMASKSPSWFQSSTSGTVDQVGSGAAEALRLALPLAKTIPLVGGTVGASLEDVLHIIQVKDVRLPPRSN